MKSNTYLSSKILDDERYRVDINGPTDEVMELLEAQTVAIFKLLKKDSGLPDTMERFCFLYKNVAKEVFNIDL